MTVGLMLGGGAPNLTLMSGALAALDEKGVEFSVVSTSGAGMVIGLLYAAPNKMTRQAALAKTREMGVSDSIYDVFPVNFKVFHKPGAMAQQYTQFMQKMSTMQMRSMMPAGNSSSEQQFSDWMQLMFAAMCPSDLGPNSKGLCEPAPRIEEVVDFSALHKYPGDFYLNACARRPCASPPALRSRAGRSAGVELARSLLHGVVRGRRGAADRGRHRRFSQRRAQHVVSTTGADAAALLGILRARQHLARQPGELNADRGLKRCRRGAEPASHQ